MKACGARWFSFYALFGSMSNCGRKRLDSAARACSVQEMLLISWRTRACLMRPFESSRFVSSLCSSNQSLLLYANCDPPLRCKIVQRQDPTLQHQNAKIKKSMPKEPRQNPEKTSKSRSVVANLKVAGESSMREKWVSFVRNAAMGVRSSFPS